MVFDWVAQRLEDCWTAVTPGRLAAIAVGVTSGWLAADFSKSNQRAITAVNKDSENEGKPRRFDGETIELVESGGGVVKMSRISAPGGWFIFAMRDGTVGNKPAMFIPDPNHEWLQPPKVEDPVPPMQPVDVTPMRVEHGWFINGQFIEDKTIWQNGRFELAEQIMMPHRIPGGWAVNSRSIPEKWNGERFTLDLTPPKPEHKKR